MICKQPSHHLKLKNHLQWSLGLAVLRHRRRSTRMIKLKQFTKLDGGGTISQKKPSKSSVEKPLLRPVSLEENRDHVSKCFDPTRCWGCLYLRNREEWGQVATWKWGGHIIGSWLCLTQHEDEDGSDFVGLSCIVCQKANVENNFSKGMVQFLDPLMGWCFNFSLSQWPMANNNLSTISSIQFI